MSDEYESDMRIWTVDEGGVTHWVQAESETLALAMWEAHVRDDWGLTTRDLGHVDDPPVVEPLSPERARGLTFREDDGTVLGTMWSEYQRDPSRRYVACSEY